MKGILHCYELSVCADICPRRRSKCFVAVLRNPFNFAEGAPDEWVEYNPWVEFWLMSAQQWAEYEKKLLYYPDQACPYCGDYDCSGDCPESGKELAEELGDGSDGEDFDY